MTRLIEFPIFPQQHIKRWPKGGMRRRSPLFSIPVLVGDTGWGAPFAPIFAARKKLKTGVGERARFGRCRTRTRGSAALLRS
jgi:hypothetical protein